MPRTKRTATKRPTTVTKNKRKVGVVYVPIDDDEEEEEEEEEEVKVDREEEEANENRKRPPRTRGTSTEDFDVDEEEEEEAEEAEEDDEGEDSGMDEQVDSKPAAKQTSEEEDPLLGTRRSKRARKKIGWNPDEYVPKSTSAWKPILEDLSDDEDMEVVRRGRRRIQPQQRRQQKRQQQQRKASSSTRAFGGSHRLLMQPNKPPSPLNLPRPEDYNNTPKRSPPAAVREPSPEPEEPDLAPTIELVYREEIQRELDMCWKAVATLASMLKPDEKNCNQETTLKLEE